MIRDAYIAHVYSTNLDGSKKAPSYVRALDLLSEMISTVPLGFSDCADIWSVASPNRLQELYHVVIEEGRKGDASQWNTSVIPPSYLQKGYCSAALRSFRCFLLEHLHEQKILSTFDEFTGEESQLSEKLDQDLEYPDDLLAEAMEREGKDVMRTIRARVNQDAFRSIILKIYNRQCCITGLDIPQVIRASHIIPWAENKSLRMDPRNGLCFSATYDAAFDKVLLSLDDDFRIILSKDLKDHYSSESVSTHFLKREGSRISMPSRCLPKREYLDQHRRKGSF